MSYQVSFEYKSHYLCYQKISPIVTSLCHEVTLFFPSRLGETLVEKFLLKCYYCAFVGLSVFFLS